MSVRTVPNPRALPRTGPPLTFHDTDQAFRASQLSERTMKPHLTVYMGMWIMVANSRCRPADYDAAVRWSTWPPFPEPI